jgi:ABC-type multidrug transport system fused ATPase/permease subunit
VPKRVRLYSVEGKMTEQGKSVSRLSDFVLAISSLSVFALLLLVTNLERAFAYSVVVMVFLSIIQTKQNSWSDKRFWMVIVAFALIHIVALSLITIPKFEFGMMIFPFALADGFAMWGILNWIDRRFPLTLC